MAGTIELITASTLRPLITHLTDVLRATPVSPLEVESIVVQSQGMRRWVTLQIADALGCAGSLALPFPAGFIHDLARRMLPDRQGRDEGEAFSRETMAWRIEALLRDLPATDVYAPLLRYLSDGDERKRFGLAARIADRFDDYQLYRADLLAAWERGGDLPGGTHARWQSALWRALCTDAGFGGVHAGARLHQLIALLQRTAPPELPARVTVFGISTLPPLFVDVLAALARHVPVTIYTSSLTAPTPHPLATAFGAQGQEFVAALRRHGAVHQVLNVPPPRVDTLLGRLQRELADGAGTTPLTLSREDASIRVHSAHGEMRQLEIIRDQVLDALQSDPTLRPHDLLVLVPDAAAWAPLVDAVFGVNEPGAPRIPYRIADRPARGDDPAAAAFSELLALQGGRFTHSEVFALLSHPLVYEAAGLSEAQVDALATLTHRANTRWGYDAHARASLGLPAYEEATWRASLDRLLIGMTTGPQGDLVLEVLPHSGDTIGDAAGIARLAQWIDAVAVAIASWQTVRSLDAWVTAMEEAVTLLFGTPELRNAEAVSSVTRLLDRLRAQAAQAQYAATVSFGVVRDWIDTELEADSFGSGFLTGGLSVAALKPMRSLPFRIIAVAGLDEGVFPRRDRRAAFDMLDVERRAGDRDLRSDDRQLFLDLLLAAGDRLILAYSGRAVSDNSPCAASVVIDELLDHVDRRSGGAARTTLLVEHPLQPFSPRYFQQGGDARLFTFLTAHARTAAASHQLRRGDLPFVTAPIVRPARERAPTFELTIAELADCWCNASRYFCRQALGFTLTTFEEEAGDDELLELSPMEQGGVRARLLSSGLRGDPDPARDLRRMQGEGAVPPGVLGAIWNTRLRESVDAVLAALPPHAPRQLSMTVTGDDWRVHGTLDGVRGEARYIARAGSFRAPHQIRAWVEHVVMCAAAEQDGADLPRQTVLLGYEKEKAKVSDRFEMVADAMSVLAALVAAARRGREEPLVFFPQAAAAWLVAHRSNAKFLAGDRRIKGIKDPRLLAMAAFEAPGDFGAPGGDDTDAHVALCFRGVDPLRDRWDDFEQLATTLFAPRLAGASA